MDCSCCSSRPGKNDRKAHGPVDVFSGTPAWPASSVATPLSGSQLQETDRILLQSMRQTTSGNAPQSFLSHRDTAVVAEEEKVQEEEWHKFLRSTADKNFEGMRIPEFQLEDARTSTTGAPLQKAPSEVPLQENDTRKSSRFDMPDVVSNYSVVGHRFSQAPSFAEAVLAEGVHILKKYLFPQLKETLEKQFSMFPPELRTVFLLLDAQQIRNVRRWMQFRYAERCNLSRGAIVMITDHVGVSADEIPGSNDCAQHSVRLIALHLGVMELDARDLLAVQKEQHPELLASMFPYLFAEELIFRQYPDAVVAEENLGF
ncbi:unnamed protein product [Amoebophrya sp. A120]|nr:unnamed protein product [Amoebophrya sp. A120]|eukprot:GSA120T00018920001.1